MILTFASRQCSFALSQLILGQINTLQVWDAESTIITEIMKFEFCYSHLHELLYSVLRTHGVYCMMDAIA